MSINPFSMLCLVAAVDGRNIQAHLTDNIEDCALCTTVSNPTSSCPASRAAEIIHATSRPLTATEIVDQLHTTGPSRAYLARRSVHRRRQ